MSEFKGKTAIVTGGTSGIGLATARSLLACEARVAILSERPQGEIDQLCEELGGAEAGVIGYHCDVRFRDQTASTVGKIIETEASIDILVNSAGITALDAICAADEAATHQMFAINFHGAYNMILAVLPHMKSKKSGSIINIASAAAELGPSGQAIYAATKAALVMLTKTLPQELKGYGVRINAVAPGGVKTPMTAAVHTPASDMMRAVRDHIGSLVPSPDPSGEYMLEAEDIANIVLWLCSSSSWGVNGTVVLADHGLSTSWSGLPADLKNID